MFLFCSITVFSDTLRDEYAADNGTYLDERDNATLKKLNSFDRNSKGGFAIMPGTVRFNYGSQIPTVVCAILELTDIAMEQNEHINSVQLGDGARWSVEYAKSGNESNPEYMSTYSEHPGSRCIKYLAISSSVTGSDATYSQQGMP